MLLFTYYYYYYILFLIISTIYEHIKYNIYKLVLGFLLSCYIFNKYY